MIRDRAAAEPDVTAHGVRELPEKADRRRDAAGADASAQVPRFDFAGLALHREPGAAVQLRARPGGASRPASGPEVHATALAGVAGHSAPLPHGPQIARAFGPAHDLSPISAHIGGPAREASDRLGASAYAIGEHVAFRASPDLRLAAHEAAHVVQQRAGVELAGGVGDPTDPYERAADAVAERVVTGRSAADLLPGPARTPAAAAVQLDPSAADPVDDYWVDTDEFFHESYETASPADKPRALRALLLFEQPLPTPMHSVDEVQKFADRCEKLAASETDTLAQLATTVDTEETLLEDGAAFPEIWSRRAASLGSAKEPGADPTEVTSAWNAARTEALRLAPTLAPDIWNRGLPLSRSMAAQLGSGGIRAVSFDVERAKSGSDEPVAIYTRALLNWARAEAHYFLVNNYEFHLREEVKRIASGDQVIDQHEWFALRDKRQGFRNALATFVAARTGNIQKTIALLMLRRADMFRRITGVTGFVFEGPKEGMDAFLLEVDKVNQQIVEAAKTTVRSMLGPFGAAAGLAGEISVGKIWRAIVWAKERDYFSEEALDFFHALIAEPYKMLATMMVILLLQEIPGVNIAVDIVLLIEFGLEIFDTISQLADAFSTVADAKDIAALQRGSVKIASSLVGAGLKLLLWAATWGAGKAVGKIKKWRDGEKFVKENSHTPEARDEARRMLSESKGDAAEAAKRLERKRAYEQQQRDLARAEQERVKAEADRKAKRAEEAADAQRRAAEEAAARKAAEEAAGAQRKAAEEAAARKAAEEAAAQRKAAEEAEQAKRRPPEDQPKDAPPSDKAPKDKPAQDKPPKKSKEERQREEAKRRAEQEAKAEAAKKKKAAKDDYKPCFFAGTLVDTPVGPIAIEAVRSGDIVLGKRPGELPRAQLVERLRTGQTQLAIHVRVGEITIQTTASHRFHVVDRGWVPARDLHPGDLLEGARGGEATVAAVDRVELPAPTATYNFGVPSEAYLLVAASQRVLVHNNGLPDFNRVLYWVWGDPQVRLPGRKGKIDWDGKSVWKTTSKADVDAMMEYRVKVDGRSVDDDHAFWTEEQISASKLQNPKTPSESALAKRLDHHSLRPPGAAADASNLSLAQLEELDAMVKQLTPPNPVEPWELQGTC